MKSIPDRVREQLSDQYDIERELTGGGMALVFLATDRELARQVVIKVLPADVASGVSASRFRSEILTVAKLQHPHIVGILRAGELDGIPYFVMPYVHGESLAVHLRRSGPTSIRETVAVFRDVARALAFAHSNGVVHRDIKPGNILLAAGSATVTDFGVAKALSSAMRSGPQNGRVTDTGVSLGTLLYMAPEQAAGDPNIDGRADIYSLGITIYEMLTGKAPFDGLSPREMLTARLTKKPPALSRIRQDIPPQLESLIFRCLEADPADRPQSADEVVEALESSHTGSGANSVPSGPWRIQEPANRKRLVIAGLAAMALVVAGGFFLLRKSPATATLSPATVNAAAPGATEVIAIMPFVSLGSDSSNSYIAAGLTNSLAARLSRAAGLSVITPSRSVDLAKTASASNPGKTVLVLEGAVERDGKMVRISARLSDSQTGIMKWADVFDRDVTNLLSVQDDIADRIVEAVAPHTAPKIDSFDRTTASLSPEQYEKYLRAKYDLSQRGAPSINRAIKSLVDITKAQPKFAPAFASLAQAYAVLPLYGPATAADSLRKLAFDAANAAVQLDPHLADALIARAVALDAMWKWNDATADFQRALSIDSLNARAHQWYGEHLLVLGNAGSAVRELTTASRLDPSSAIMAGSLAVALAHAGRADDAIHQAQAAVAMDPSFATTHFMYGAVLLYSGKPKDALIPLGEALQLAPDSRTVLGLLGYAQAASGDTQLAARTLKRIEQSPSVFGSDPAIARIRVAMGDVAGGLAALQKAAAKHDPFFTSEPITSPPFGSLKSDPRFVALVRDIGLTGI